MGGLSGDFKRTMSRIGKAMTSSGSSGICLLVVFIVIVFVVLWRVIRLLVCWESSDGMTRPWVIRMDWNHLWKQEIHK